MGQTVCLGHVGGRAEGVRQVRLVMKPKTTLPQVLLRASAWPDPIPPGPAGPLELWGPHACRPSRTPLSQACIVLPVPVPGLPFQRDSLDAAEKEELLWASLRDTDASHRADFQGCWGGRFFAGSLVVSGRLELRIPGRNWAPSYCSISYCGIST